MKKTYLLLGAIFFLSVFPSYAEDVDAKIRNLERQLTDLQELTQQLHSEVTSLKAERVRGVSPAGPVDFASEEAQAESNFVITGYADALFKKKEGVDGTFMVGHFNPIFLYRMSDRLLFEAEVEFEPRRSSGEGSELEIGLEYATIDYVLNDYLTIGAGKFLLPVGVWLEKIHPAWVHKLPSKPLPYDKKLLPSTTIGIEGRGAIHVGDAVLAYTVFGSNGPTSETEDGVESLTLGDENAQDNNGNKAFGGRGAIFYPFNKASAELGLSGYIGNYDDAGDLTYSAIVIDAEFHALDKLLEIRGEGLFTTEETTAGDIDRKGAYVQGAYKLAAFDAPIISSTELVLRYSLIRSDEADKDQDQITIGVNYYLTNTSLIKLAYDFNDGDTDSADADVFIIQWAYGF